MLQRVVVGVVGSLVWSCRWWVGREPKNEGGWNGGQG